MVTESKVVEGTFYNMHVVMRDDAVVFTDISGDDETTFAMSQVEFLRMCREFVDHADGRQTGGVSPAELIEAFDGMAPVPDAEIDYDRLTPRQKKFYDALVSHGVCYPGKYFDPAKMGDVYDRGYEQNTKFKKDAVANNADIFKIKKDFFAAEKLNRKIYKTYPDFEIAPGPDDGEDLGLACDDLEFQEKLDRHYPKGNLASEQTIGSFDPAVLRKFGLLRDDD